MAFYVIRILKRNVIRYTYASYLFINQKELSYNAIDVGLKQKVDSQFPEYFNFFGDVIQSWAIKEKNNQKAGNAFWFLGEHGKEIKWSFQELCFHTQKTANVLKSLGLKKGSRIIIILPKTPEWWLIVLASIQLGIISSPGTTQLRPKDILYRINSFKAECIFTDSQIAEIVDQIENNCPSLKTKVICLRNNERLKPGWTDFKSLYETSKPLQECAKTNIYESMNVFFTSGTTGFPKMVNQGHSKSMATTILYKYWMNCTPHDLVWNMADPGWAKTSWGSFFFPWAAGASVFVHHSARFDPELTLKILENYPISGFCAPPTVYKMLVQFDLKKYNFPNLRLCTSGGEALTSPVCDEWKKHTGLDIDQLYGQTETTILCSTSLCRNKKAGSMGYAPVEMPTTIINNDCEEVGPFVEGDIALKTKPHYPIGLFLEYLDNPEKTVSAFRNGYYITGDRGYKDDDGYFWYVGRNDDIIISAGYRIGPSEVESVLQEHPAVVESAVIGVPDSIRGEIVKAFIVLREDFQKVDKDQLITDLQNYVKNATSPYKYPRKIEFVKELSKTVSGKVQRFKLREQEQKSDKDKTV